MGFRPPARRHPCSARDSQVHALTHPDLEAPLLLAAALIVQAAEAVARGRLGCPAAASTSGSRCPSRTPAASAAAAAAPSKRKRSADRSSGGGGGGNTGGLVAPAAGGAAEGPALICCPRALEGEEEEAATRAVVEELFPRGWLRELPPCEGEDGGQRGDSPAAAIEESWALLTRGLEAKLSSNASGCRPCTGLDGYAVPALVDPKEFPLLLSRRVHELVVRGLAANLLEVEVREGAYIEGKLVRGQQVIPSD